MGAGKVLTKCRQVIQDVNDAWSNDGGIMLMGKVIHIQNLDLDVIAEFIAKFYKQNAPYESQTQERPITNERDSNTEHNKLYEIATKNARETNTVR